MSGAGAEKPATELGIEDLREGRGGTWAVDRRVDGDWRELERFGSEEKAEEWLDEIAATEEIALEDLRTRHVH
jgi:hypothetical protein